MPIKKAKEKPKTFAWEPATATWTWAQIVRRAMAELGGEASLAALYALIEQHPRAAGRKHARAKVRQVIQRSREYARVAHGFWGFSSRYSAADLAEFEEGRRARYPRARGARN